MSYRSMYSLTTDFEFQKYKRAWHHKEHLPIPVRVSAHIVSGQIVQVQGF